MDYAIRQKKLAIELGQAGVDALLITHLPNIRYLCGFTGTAGALLVPAGLRRAMFITDGRYTQQTSEEMHGAQGVISRKPAWMAARERAQKAGTAPLGFEGQPLSYGSYHEIAKPARRQ